MNPIYALIAKSLKCTLLVPAVLVTLQLLVFPVAADSVGRSADTAMISTTFAVTSPKGNDATGDSQDARHEPLSIAPFERLQLGLNKDEDQRAELGSRSRKEDSDVVSLCEYLPLAVGNRWVSLPGFDQGSSLTVDAHFERNGFDVWQLTMVVRSIGPYEETFFLVFVGGFLYRTPSLEDLDSLPEINGAMEPLFPEEVEFGVPIVLPSSDSEPITLVAERGSFLDLVGNLSVSFPLGDLQDAIKFTGDRPMCIFARGVGPIIYESSGLTAVLDVFGGCRFDVPILERVQSVVAEDATAPELDGSNELTFNGDASILYVRSFEGILAMYDRDQSTGILSFLRAFRDGEGSMDGLTGSGRMALSPDGRHLYMVSRDNGELSAYSVEPSTQAITFVETLSAEADAIPGLARALNVGISHDGALVYAASNEEHTFLAFRRDPELGTLDFVSSYDSESEGVYRAIAPIAVSPDDRYIYVGGIDASSISVFERDVDDTHRFLNRTQLEELGPGESLVTALSLSPSGRQLYAGVTHFAIDATDEHLSPFRTGSILVFDRDELTGELSLIERHPGYESVAAGAIITADLAVSPDGRYLVASSSPSRAISIYERDLETGRLALRQGIQDDKAYSLGLGNPAAIEISPDSRYLYAASFVPDVVTVHSIGPPDVFEGDGEREGQPADGAGEGEGANEGDGEGPIEGERDGESAGDGEPSPEGEAPDEGVSEGAIDGDGEDTGCAFTFDSSLAPPKSRAADPGVWLPLLAACVWLYARGRFARP